MGDMADYYMDCAYANYEDDLAGGELSYGRYHRTNNRPYKPKYKYKYYQSPICKDCRKSLVWGLSSKGNHMLCERDGITPHKCSAEIVFSKFIKETNNEDQDCDLWY